MAAVYGAGWLLGPDTRGMTGAATADDPAAAGGPVLRANGIAMLPFVTRAAEDGPARFVADGLHDDLLTRLAGVPELVVISRTSVEQYRGMEKSIPDIGWELSMAWVLEGGVEQAGERLRVDAQLVAARTDEHLWAETLDGDLALDDILSIQTHLANRITEAMETTLTGMPGGGEARPTESPAGVFHSIHAMGD